MRLDDQIYTRELKARGVEKPDMKLRAPEELEEVETSSKSKITLNISDYTNIALKWLRTALSKSGEYLTERVGQVLSVTLRPYLTWFFIGLFIVVVLTLVL